MKHYSMDTDEMFFPGYPLYPDNEDIYNKGEKAADIDPENTDQLKSSGKRINSDAPNEQGFKEDHSGGDLDIPGSELDDNEEILGSEDEENNYYSIGGDNHDNLEEDNGD